MAQKKSILLALIISFFNIPLTLAHGGDSYSMMSHLWGLDLGFFGMFIMFLLMIIFWGAILYFAYLLVMKFLGHSKSFTKRSSPIDIVKKRLAKGEITKKEFRELKKELKEFMRN